MPANRLLIANDCYQNREGSSWQCDPVETVSDEIISLPIACRIPLRGCRQVPLLYGRRVGRWTLPVSCTPLRRVNSLRAHGRMNHSRRSCTCPCLRTCRFCHRRRSGNCRSIQGLVLCEGLCQSPAQCPFHHPDILKVRTRQQVINQLAAFLRICVGNEICSFLRRRQQSDQVDVRAT